ncbi:hypothetical protein [Planomicrobium sp. CPCC 101079]|uniref:hypothetical protein n=1 Tax=Planomicrobium sp. CPCC 101079 TaxID=2599618 RepID=UPI0011B62991|nr:hypothetical protein [Planomicrobium sp. CPCC 101079]TWT09224.1 hypothetical protein FQV28_06205 [Planomicrobium sp. CPCC 101079]
MSRITFLASSKPFEIPEEIQAHNQHVHFENEEDVIFFSVQKIDENWLKEIQDLFSLPYIYEVEGAGSQLFLTYLENHMETGDVLEIYSVPNQHAFHSYKKKAQEMPEPIEVNTGNHTYRDASGLYQLKPKKWLEELSRRNYITHHGITTFVKY